ncbi:sterol desaturase family protein [Amaricoccus solimangrovi]|uniref:Sterol desaturase family protein n=1 Tax=Amaricoccus solimangrovi TaxID=2589815 RepID=A0A501W3S7_9RHOB|nr:sterol desaturase family protein [Amaricoccus solimangrovi]TPE44563.1 sterol desaturase family protein [Amaricoccus solimangrovi]
MDDLKYGTRNKRGDWAPNATVEIAPFWAWPPALGRVLRWLPEYLWPWNAFHMATALAYWYLVVPDVETARTLTPGWILWLYAVNALAIFAMYGGIELFYYIKRVQGTRFKFNGKFPAEQPSDVFWFKSQNIDNFLRSFFVTIPMWTVIEVAILWCHANGIGTWLAWSDHPVYLALLVFFAPFIHEVHFFFIHRAIHWPPLYKWIHSVHHNSINPSPWSSLSMHPVEGFAYFAVGLWHLVIPSNPIVALFQLNIAGFGAVNGHIGFDKLELTDETALDSHAFTHYLHHKYFEVNYGGDGLIPLDKWFGTWHDGSKEGDAMMNARFKKRKDRMKEKESAAASM